ncbi:MAG: RNA polymerase sigma factor [Acidimicrobiales bacterium]
MSKPDVNTDWTRMSDEELALHCSSEMGACLEELVGRHEERIRDCARRMSLERDQAEDLVGEIHLRLVASLAHFEGRSAFGTWLYRLAHNTCIDAFRRDSRRARVALKPGGRSDPGPDDVLAELPATWGDPEADFDEQIRQCYLGQALARLPPDYRRVVLLRLGEGRSSAEVAQTLGTSVDSVKAKLRRARRRLQDDLLTRRSCPFCQGTGSFRITGSGVS